jgi:hypothetical protein
MVKPQAAQHTAKIEREDEHILGQAEVQPGHIEIISLGMYEQGMPEPTLTLEARIQEDARHHRRPLTRADMLKQITLCGQAAAAEAQAKPILASFGLLDETRCAARRPVVSLIQLGGTRNNVLGSDGLPGAER